MSEEQQVIETPATETIAAPAVVEEVTTDAEGTQPEEKPAEEKKFTQEEVDKILQKRLTKLERKLEKQISEAARKPEPVAETQLTKPKVEDFTDYADYIEAIADYKAEEKIRSFKQEAQQERINQSYKSEADRREALEVDLMEKGNDKYDDFDEVAAGTGAFLKSKGLSFSQTMVGALLETSNASDIVYFLGTDLEEAARIAALPPNAQAKEMGRLEDKLTTKPPVKTSSAPEPIKPVGGAKAITETDPAKMTDKQFAEWRKRQIAAR